MFQPVANWPIAYEENDMELRFVTIMEAHDSFEAVVASGMSLPNQSQRRRYQIFEVSEVVIQAFEN